MAKKTNTLNRWHKVTDRIRNVAAELSQKTEQTLACGRSMDGDTFSVRRAALNAATAKAVGEQKALYFTLQHALFAIRRAVSRANTAAGVSDLLNQQEEAKQDVAYYDRLLAAVEGAMSQEEFAELVARKSKNPQQSQVYGLHVTFLSVEQIAELAKERDAMRRQFEALSDQLATANATQLTLDIDDQVIAVVGL